MSPSVIAIVAFIIILIFGAFCNGKRAAEKRNKKIMDYYSSERESLLAQSFPECTWSYETDIFQQRRVNFLAYSFTVVKDFPVCSIPMNHFIKETQCSDSDGDTYYRYYNVIQMSVTPHEGYFFQLPGSFHIHVAGASIVKGLEKVGSFFASAEKKAFEEQNRTTDRIRFGNGHRFDYNGINNENRDVFLAREPLKIAEEIFAVLGTFKSVNIHYNSQSLVLAFAENYSGEGCSAPGMCLENDIVVENADKLLKAQELFYQLAETVLMP